MADSNVIDLAAWRRSRDEAAAPADRHEAMEDAALHMFEAIAEALNDGADPREVDRLVERMDSLLGALDGT